MAGLIENTERQAQRAENQLGPEHQPSAIVAIRESAADQSERDRRDRAKHAVQSELHGRIGQLIEQPIGRRHLHPSADVGDEQTKPEQAKVAVAKGGKAARPRRWRTRCVAHQQNLVYER